MYTTTLLQAIDFLHSIKLIHTDLKPENVLLRSWEEREVKLDSGEIVRVPVDPRIKGERGDKPNNTAAASRFTFGTPTARVMFSHVRCVFFSMRVTALGSFVLPPRPQLSSLIAPLKHNVSPVVRTLFVF